MKAISEAIVAVAAFVPVPSAELGGDNEGEQWEVRKFDNKTAVTRGTMPKASSPRYKFAKTTTSSHYVHP